MKTYHVDGGAKIEPPNYKFHDAYFSVIDDNHNQVHVDIHLGDIYSGLAEFLAIKWVVDEIKERPLKITSDCQTAIAWAKKGGNTKKHKVEPLDLTDIELQYQHNNLADQFNAKYTSPKKDRSEYYQRWVDAGKPPRLHSKPKYRGGNRKTKGNKELTLFDL